jgi:putative endonuclease
MFYAYILENPKGILYKGSTDNLVKRITQHNSNNGFLSFTSKRGPWRLVYSEKFESRREAEIREKFFKTGKGREFLKNKIISKSNYI